MDGGAWQAIVHGVSRAGHDLVTKPPQLHMAINMTVVKKNDCSEDQLF